MYYESKMSTPLNHYGVLGMRWGVRHDKDGLFSRKSSRTTRGLEYRLKKDEKRIAKGKRPKFDDDKMREDLAESRKKDKKLQDYVMTKSRGKIALQVICNLGSRKAMYYNQARMEGYSRFGALYAAPQRRMYGPDGGLIFENLGRRKGMNQKYKNRSK